MQEFQEEAALWEERLTKLNAVLDAWVDVQRRWLYLEGIFFASRDIKQQLPSEFAVRVYDTVVCAFVPTPLWLDCFFMFVTWFIFSVSHVDNQSSD